MQYYTFKDEDLFSLLFSYFELVSSKKWLGFFELKVPNVKTKQNKWDSRLYHYKFFKGYLPQILLGHS